MLRDWLTSVGMKTVSTELMRNIYSNVSSTHGVLAVTVTLRQRREFAVGVICGSQRYTNLRLALDAKQTNHPNKNAPSCARPLLCICTSWAWIFSTGTDVRAQPVAPASASLEPSCSSRSGRKPRVWRGESSVAASFGMK